MNDNKKEREREKGKEKNKEREKKAEEKIVRERKRQRKKNDLCEKNNRSRPFFNRIIVFGFDYIGLTSSRSFSFFFCITKLHFCYH